MWSYNSSAGLLYIVPLSDGTFGIKFGGIVWESCTTPQAEADNVFCRVTGCPDIDALQYVPADLSGWTYSPL